MAMYFIERILFAACCGIFAAIYKDVLAYEPVLNWWFRFGARYENRRFFAPIWGCVRCISGQWALWFYVFIFPHQLNIWALVADFWGLIFSICGSIFIAMICSRFINNHLK